MKLSPTMKFLTIMGLSLVLAGCAGTGNERLRTETESTVSSKIVQDATTKDEIRSMFGSPNKTSFTDSGLEIWNYEFAKVSADVVNFIPIVNLFGSSASGTKKELVVLFNDKNVVQRFSMSESDVATKTGIFNN
jgi:hypothetical protein